MRLLALLLALAALWASAAEAAAVSGGRRLRSRAAAFATAHSEAHAAAKRIFGTAGESHTAYDFESCFACELTWRQIHVSLPSNPSAEDVNAAFDEFCSNPVPVFEQGCRDMAAQRWKMVEDYLAYPEKTFDTICSNAQVCWTGLMSSI